MNYILIMEKKIKFLVVEDNPVCQKVLMHI